MNAVTPLYKEPLAKASSCYNPLDSPIEQFEAGLDRRQTNRHALIHWIKNNLVEGVDFGSIKTKRGASKPSLWKAGAEKITTMLSVSACFPSYGDYEQYALSEHPPLQQIVIRCELMNAQQLLVASGIGARSLKQDFGDLNKALKMASKSAFIDATLKLAGLSDLFTLDLEDMLPEQLDPEPQKSHAPPSNVQRISAKQLATLQEVIENSRIHPEKLLAWLSRVCEAQGYLPIQQFSELPVILLEQVMNQLPKFADTADA